MAIPYKASQTRAPGLVRLSIHIDQEAMELLQAECARSPKGRYLGLARAVNKCVYAYLGGKKIYGEKPS